MFYPSLSLVLCLLLQVTSTVVLCQQAVCPGSPQPLITGDRYRVTDEQLTASSSYSNAYRPPEARVGVGAVSWCSDTSDTQLWFQVDFNTDVIIHSLQIGGYDGFSQFSRYHINEFRIEHGPNSSQLSSVLLPNSSDPMIFTRDDTPDVRATPLPTPLTTRVLRIVSEEHTGSVPCLYLEALGCSLITGCVIDELLSSNRSLLPLSSITASSAILNSPAEDAVDSTENGWCSTEAFNEEQPNPYIVFNFTDRVILTHIRARGSVREFTLDYRDDLTDSYTAYNTLEQLGEGEEEFSTDSSSELTHTFWRQPLQGRTFRFNIQDGVRNDDSFCWNVEIFGCVSLDQESDDDDLFTTTIMTTTDATQPSSLPATSTPQTDATTTLGSVGSMGVSTGAIVGGTLGGVIVLVLLLLLTVLLLGCILTAKQKPSKTRLAEPEVVYSRTEGDVRIVNNDIYGEDTPPSSPTTHYKKQTGEIHYKSLKTPPTNDVDIGNTYEAIGSPNVKASSTPYESMGSSLVYTYAKVDTPIRVVLPGNTQSEGFDENKQNTNSEKKEYAITANTAYGSLENDEAYVAMSSELEDSSKGVTDNPLYGSMEL